MSEQLNMTFEKANGLPPGWSLVTPADLAAPHRYSLGIGPFGSNLKVSDYRDEGVPLVFVRNIRSGVFGGNGDKFVSDNKAEDLRAHETRAGDVLITKMGDPPGDSFVYPEARPPAIITADCIRWRIHPHLGLAWFFAFATRTPRVRNQILQKTKGVAQKKVSLARFKQVTYPMAPLPEQERIVAEIDKHFTRLDDAVATLERVQAKLKRARASVLKAAVEGRLVPTEAALAKAEGRTYEPAADLLKRILAERKRKHDEEQAAAGRKKKYKPPVEPDTKGLPELPEGWVWAGIDQLSVEVTDGDHQPPPVTETGVPFLVIGNVRTGRLEFDGCRRVPDDYYRGLAWKRRPDSNDLLYTVVGSFGIPVRVPDDRPFCVQRHIAILKSPLGGVKEYLLHAMASPRFYWAASKKATGTAQKTVGLKSLRGLAVALPPKAEQERIVAEVERRLSVLDAADQAVERNITRCANLRQSILKRAFEGKLVPQDPSDEPATALLARIQAQSA